MTIGEKIRELRSKKDITQKKLAEYLGISFQSVSKWENDTALPDVSYIVPLANFFGVTSDEILCNDNKENELREYEFEYLNFMRIAKINEAVSLCRNIIKQYPKNFKWLYNLACALYEVAIHKEKFSREISTSAFKECTDICNRLLDDCTDSEIRYSCRKYLVFLYADNGEYEKAIYEAKKAPSFIDSKEILLDYVGNPDDPIALQRRDDHLLLYISLFCQLLIQMRNDEETIKGIEVATKIWELLVDDKNYLYYCSDMIFYI